MIMLCLPVRRLRELFALWLIAVPSLAFAQETPPVELPPPEKFHLFILAGQSNMAGRGEVSEQDRTPHPRVLMFNRDQKWVPAVDPLHFDKPAAGTGLGKTFGQLVAESDPEITVGLIPCAVGGTSITTWEPGIRDKATGQYPWDNCMARANVALPAGTLKGVLWHQGEADASPAGVENYATRLKGVIVRFRTDLKSPQAPFLLGELGEFPSKPWNNSARTLDQILYQVAEDLPGVVVVSSDGLKDKGDKVHFDAESYREFGRRYAEAYLHGADQP